MGEVVELQDRQLIDDSELVADLCRFSEGVLTEKQVRKKHHLIGNDVWTKLGDDDALVEKIEDEKIRRIRSGVTKREKAQNEIVDAPPILAGIMRNPNSNARHIVDSIKVLDGLASGGAEAAAAGARFEITIIMNADSGGDANHIEHYSKSIASNPNDEDPVRVDTTDVIAASALNKSKGDDDGGHI